MKFFLFLLAFLLISCTKKTPESIAIEFKKMQYIYFESTIPMLHPDTDLQKYNLMNNKKDFRNYKKYIKNFKISTDKVIFNSPNEVNVHLDVSVPDIAKIIPVFGNFTESDLPKFIDKDNLPLNTFKSIIHLKKINNDWKVIMEK